MGKLTAMFLAGLFAVAVTLPGVAAAACAGHTVTAEADTVTTSKTTTPVTPVPETTTGG